MKHLCLNGEKADMVRGKKDKFVDYRGKKITITAVVNLFRILDKHPELVEEIR